MSKNCGCLRENSLKEHIRRETSCNQNSVDVYVHIFYKKYGVESTIKKGGFRPVKSPGPAPARNKCPRRASREVRRVSKKTTPLHCTYMHACMSIECGRAIVFSCMSPLSGTQLARTPNTGQNPFYPLVWTRSRFVPKVQSIQ